MHDLKTNFDKILAITNQALANKLDAGGNLQHYPRKPKLSDNEIITLSICRVLSAKLTAGENAFIVDSIPVPVCKIVRQKQLKICSY